jgi:hypothetical protein
VGIRRFGVEIIELKERIFRHFIMSCFFPDSINNIHDIYTMIWPLTSMSAGAIGFLVWIMVAATAAAYMVLSEDETMDQETLTIICGGAACVIFIVNLYKIIKMWTCSCSCNNCY